MGIVWLHLIVKTCLGDPSALFFHVWAYLAISRPKPRFIWPHGILFVNLRYRVIIINYRPVKAMIFTGVLIFLEKKKKYRSSNFHYIYVKTKFQSNNYSNIHIFDIFITYTYNYEEPKTFIFIIKIDNIFQVLTYLTVLLKITTTLILMSPIRIPYLINLF